MPLGRAQRTGTTRLPWQQPAEIHVGALLPLSASMLQMKTKLVAPAPLESFEVELEDAARVKVRRHGNRDGERAMLSHGNECAADAYLPFWQQLMPKYDVL